MPSKSGKKQTGKRSHREQIESDSDIGTGISPRPNRVMEMSVQPSENQSKVSTAISRPPRARDQKAIAKEKQNSILQNSMKK